MHREDCAIKCYYSLERTCIERIVLLNMLQCRYYKQTFIQVAHGVVTLHGAVVLIYESCTAGILVYVPGGKHRGLSNYPRPIHRLHLPTSVADNPATAHKLTPLCNETWQR